jgi:hypothetical protein
MEASLWDTFNDFLVSNLLSVKNSLVW